MVYINHGFEAAVAQVHVLLYTLLLRVSGELLLALLRLVAFHKDQIFAYPGFTEAYLLWDIKTVQAGCRKIYC